MRPCMPHDRSNTLRSSPPSLTQNWDAAACALRECWPAAKRCTQRPLSFFSYSSSYSSSSSSMRAQHGRNESMCSIVPYSVHADACAQNLLTPHAHTLTPWPLLRPHIPTPVGLVAHTRLDKQTPECPRPPPTPSPARPDLRHTCAARAALPDASQQAINQPTRCDDHRPHPAPAPPSRHHLAIIIISIIIIMPSLR